MSAAAAHDNSRTKGILKHNLKKRETEKDFQKVSREVFSTRNRFSKTFHHCGECRRLVGVSHRKSLPRRGTPTGVIFAAQRRETAAVALPPQQRERRRLRLSAARDVRKSTRLQAALAVAAQLLIYYIVTFMYCVVLLIAAEQAAHFDLLLHNRIRALQHLRQNVNGARRCGGAAAADLFKKERHVFF
jgi:hypothetical protein